jgi:hypothetical protein
VKSGERRAECQADSSSQFTPNTNTTRDEFEYHSDDAIMPESLRATWLALYGVRNPPRTLMGYVPIPAVLGDIEPHLGMPLGEPWRLG